MTNIIDFKTLSQLREELSSKQEECDTLRSQLSSIHGVSEMLTLQILDLKEQVSEHLIQMQVIQNILDRLLSKLSNIG